MPDTEPELLPLDVGLINGRSHVQGSEMLACILALPDLRPSLNWSIERAQFHRMTGCVVGIDPLATSLDVDRHVASAVAKTGTERRAYFLSASDEPAPPRTIIDTIIQPIELTGGAEHEQLMGSFEYSGVSGYRALLEAVVQAAKMRIIRTVPGSMRHMFTSLGANSLPQVPDDGWVEGRIRIEQIRRMHTAAATQTMNRFHITARDGRSCAGVFGFAFQQPTDSPAEQG